MSDSPVKFEWTKERTKLLISLLENIPLLWDVSRDDHKNRKKRTTAIEQLAHQFNVDAGEVNRKLHNLKTQFNNELRKTRKRRSGHRAGEVYTSQWEFFDALQFMLPSSKSMETQSDFESSENDKNENSAGTSRKVISKISKTQMDDVYLENAIEVMNLSKTQDDDAQIFGNFVASAIRNLRSEHYRRQLKRKIQTDILEIEELDDGEITQLVY